MTQEIKILDTTYDISSYIKNHPGGESILKYWLNKDATIPFLEFHSNIDKVSKFLKSLPIIKKYNVMDEKQHYDFSTFISFRNFLKNNGYYKHNKLHAFKRLSELILLFGLSTFLLKKDYWYLSVISYGWFGSRCGWVQHECGHRSFLGHKYDKIIQPIVMGLGLGSSSDSWNVGHNRHHASTQVKNQDVDLKTLPFVCFNSNLLPKKIPPIVKYQKYTFHTIVCPFITQNFWVYYSHIRFIIRRGHLGLDGKSMILHHTLLPYLVSLYTDNPFLFTYLTLWISKSITSFHLFSNFALSHSHTPLNLDNSDWVRSALNHTIDINPKNHFINYYMGFLNCQTVHHLFPMTPQFRHPEMSKLLKVWCEKHNLSYNITSYFDAWKKTIDNLNIASKVL
tara:strand:- start:900 stop:2084 length:1185 start_codon:yes stop_codon:yes gene_type:complete